MNPRQLFIENTVNAIVQEIVNDLPIDMCFCQYESETTITEEHFFKTELEIIKALNIAIDKITELVKTKTKWMIDQELLRECFDYK
jgi:hypothetical protein